MTDYKIPMNYGVIDYGALLTHIGSPGVDKMPILEALVSHTKASERDRCASIATAVFMNRGTCKFGTDHGKGWNQACWDIHHRITDPNAFLTQSPGPAMVQALQAVKRDGIKLSADTLVAVCEALEQFKTPKDL